MSKLLITPIESSGIEPFEIVGDYAIKDGAN